MAKTTTWDELPNKVISELRRKITELPKTQNTSGESCSVKLYGELKAFRLALYDNGLAPKIADKSTVSEDSAKRLLNEKGVGDGGGTLYTRALAALFLMSFEKCDDEDIDNEMLKGVIEFANKYRDVRINQLTKVIALNYEKGTNQIRTFLENPELVWSTFKQKHGVELEDTQVQLPKVKSEATIGRTEKLNSNEKERATSPNRKNSEDQVSEKERGRNSDGEGSELLKTLGELGIGNVVKAGFSESSHHFKEHLTSAKRIRMFVVTGSTVLNEFHHLFVEALERGSSVKIQIILPSEKRLSAGEKRSFRRGRVSLRKDIKRAESIIGGIYDEARQQNKGKNLGTLHLRKYPGLNKVPLIICDDDYVFFKLTLPPRLSADSVSFELVNVEGGLIEAFKEHFDWAWSLARDVEIKQKTHPLLDLFLRHHSS